MKETCGCCEGIEKLTPAKTLNAPGLSALSYRIGTHASFLATMKARLSNHYLEVEDLDAAGRLKLDDKGQPVTKKIFPLRELTTRAANDPSISLLDAWAVVADVLTFYQERIANEGYLRTAVERRSVLELARLIGYELRPGVAASVYLAYTLDQNSIVMIPALSRAQTVPGPGELPQSFETASDLPASSLWNTLKPRLTRPQSIESKTKIEDKFSLYFKGTATNLIVNDPLLIIFNSDPTDPKGQIVYRIIEVKPDPAANRTQVAVRPWMQPSKEAATSPGDETISVARPGSLLDSIKEIIRRNTDPSKFGSLLSTQTGMRVQSLFDDLKSSLEQTTSTAMQLRKLEEDTLPNLNEEKRLASSFNRLEPWIGGIITELEEAVKGQIAFDNVLKSLEKQPSIQPANDKQLDRDIREAFGAGSYRDPSKVASSDVTSALLTTLRPALAGSFYKALENLPVTKPPAVGVYALRIRASVFGHNAPLEQIRDREGKIIGQKEWDLKRFAPATRERFRITLMLSRIATGQGIITTIEIGDKQIVDPLSGSPRPLTDGDTFTIDFAEASEKIKVVVSNITQGAPEVFTLDMKFEKRSIDLTVSINRDRGFQVSSLKSNLKIVGLGIRQTTEGGDTENAVAVASSPSITIEGELVTAPVTSMTEVPDTVTLDALYKQILPGSFVVVERPRASPLGDIPQLSVAQAKRVSERSRADYGVTLKGTQLQLSKNWLNLDADITIGDDFGVIRGTTVFAQSEFLELTEEPIDPIEGAICGDELELEGLYPGLQSGRWLIISGERTDVRLEPQKENAASRTDATSASPAKGLPPETAPISGLKATELVMLSGVTQGYETDLPGDSAHTTLVLAEQLAYCYKRDTVTIYANVVQATHGETRREILGNGDAGKSAQAFTLHQSPLTYLPSPTPAGAESTLEVRVNDVLWHETDTLAFLGPNDRRFITRTDNESKTTVIFGNGAMGARLPTGVENVKAVYRTGIGKAGNVKSEQISLLSSQPLGVKGVINPLPATGGADRESRDQGRRHAPLAVASLDRLVSVRDYENFARTFAGIGKASAAQLTDGRQQLIYLTIAGADDIPITESSDLYRNLRAALYKLGDPSQPVQIAMRLLLLLIISVKVRLDPNYLWEFVEPKIRAALLKKFSFDERELGQDVLLGEVIATVHTIEGVVYVDVDILDAVPQDILTTDLITLGARLKLNQGISVEMASINRNAIELQRRIRPAQLAILSPSVPDTLILTELKA